MKRTEGYLIGKKTVRGITAWTVGVREEGKPIRKLRVGSISLGVVLWPGIDVDFLVQENNGQTIAADVALCVVTETKQKGIQTMKLPGAEPTGYR